MGFGDPALPLDLSSAVRFFAIRLGRPQLSNRYILSSDSAFL
jgi:hypothetical protein